MPVLPTGTITFLFTDIEGSTRLWEAYPDVMRAALARHDALMREAIGRANGYVFKTIGDAFCAAFETAPDAVTAALAAQRALASEPWPAQTPIKVRMALHTGAVESRDDDYFGPPLNRVARLLATGYGGQTILSQTSFDLVRDLLPDAVSLQDLGAHRLKDLARPEQVYQLQHPALIDDFPPLKSLSTRPNNLPQQFSRFIGREKEIAEVEDLMAKARLLTLTGSGGSGKTRLSLQVAADALERFPDGVWFVEMAPLTDPDRVSQTAANALEVREESGRSIVETLTNYLKDKRLLLILDNCEHLLDACARLVDALIRHCPGVHILASSREALGITGEQAYRVPSLSLPDPKQAQTPETLSQYESARLFIDRALLARPDFQVTNQNAPALASLCFHLDGIPLAIELAAARIRSLSVEEIAGKLDQRFRLLTGGSRTALPRQQTLRALIDWSYDLLSPSEKALLQRLSVFAGGWTLASAEQVCAGDLVEEWEVLDLLTSLSAKSLTAAEQQQGITRIRMLETVRQYARDRLFESGAGDVWRHRHLSYFVAMAEEAEPHLKGPEQAEWLERLEVEHDNLRSALEWSREPEAAEVGLRLAGALWRFWLVRGHLSEGRAWLSALLTAEPGGQAPVARANALNGGGVLAVEQGDYPAARSLFEESWTIRKALGDRQGAANALGKLGIVAYRQGDYAAARAMQEESLAIQRELGDRPGIANALGNLGNVAFAQEDGGAARAYYEESLTILRELSDGQGIANALGNLGSVSYRQGDYATARTMQEESLGIQRDLGDRPGIANTLGNLASACFYLGDYVTARAMQEESLTILQELGDREGIVSALEDAASLASSEEAPKHAARLWGAAGRLREEIGSPPSPADQARYAREVAAVRQALGDDVFDATLQDGRSLSLEQAITLAREAK